MPFKCVSRVLTSPVVLSPTRGRMVEEQRHMEEKDAIRQKSAER